MLLPLLLEPIAVNVHTFRKLVKTDVSCAQMCISLPFLAW